MRFKLFSIIIMASIYANDMNWSETVYNMNIVGSNNSMMIVTPKSELTLSFNAALIKNSNISNHIIISYDNYQVACIDKQSSKYITFNAPHKVGLYEIVATVYRGEDCSQSSYEVVDSKVISQVEVIKIENDINRKPGYNIKMSADRMYDSSLQFYSNSQAQNYPQMYSKNNNLSFSTGGSKDINHFRTLISNDVMPESIDIAYEGLFYDYYFNTNMQQQCNELFCPSYSMAISKDPISNVDEYYLSVGLNSGINEEDFKRKKVNMVVVLDISGSMDSKFKNNSIKNKIQIANESIIALIEQLNSDDRLGVVVFETNASIAKPINRIGDYNIELTKQHILNIRAKGSTNMYAGIEMAYQMINNSGYSDNHEYENRIIVLTDAMPNTGRVNDSNFMHLIKHNADKNVYTTFIGVGLDFESKLVDTITQVKGSNYYSVNSEEQFRKRMNDDFDYMVTPMVFDLSLSIDAKGLEIEKIYGVPGGNIRNGEILKINTLFPSDNNHGEGKGGIILVKLNKYNNFEEDVNIRVSYKDRDGNFFVNEENVSFSNVKCNEFSNTGIQKGIILTRYADILKQWINDAAHDQMRLSVSYSYVNIFSNFYKYFEQQVNIIGDESLKAELAVLDKLIDSSDRNIGEYENSDDDWKYFSRAKSK